MSSSSCDELQIALKPSAELSTVSFHVKPSRCYRRLRLTKSKLLARLFISGGGCDAYVHPFNQANH
jgi:hypothetical protein